MVDIGRSLPKYLIEVVYQRLVHVIECTKLPSFYHIFRTLAIKLDYCRIDIEYGDYVLVQVNLIFKIDLLSCQIMQKNRQFF